MSSIVRNAAKLFSGNIAATGLSVVGGVLVARALGPAARGQLAAIQVIPGLMVTFFQAGVRQSVVKEATTEDADRNSIFATVIGLWAVVCLLTVVVGILTYSTSVVAGRASHFLLAILIVPGSVLLNWLCGLLLVDKHYSVLANVRVVPQVVRIAIIVGLVLLGQIGTSQVLAATLFAEYTMLAIAFFIIRPSRLRVSSAKLRVARSLVSFGAIYALTLFVHSLNYRVDVMLLQYLSTAEEVGLYSVGVTLAEQVWQIPMAISPILFLRGTDQSGSVRSVAQALQVSMFACCVAALLLSITVSFLLPLVYGSDYSGSVPMVQAILPGILFFTIFKVLNSDLAGRGKPHVALFVMLAGVVINISLNLVLIPPLGGVGAAMASTVSYTFSALLFLFCYSIERSVKVLDLFRFDPLLLKLSSTGASSKLIQTLTKK